MRDLTHQTRKTPSGPFRKAQLGCLIMLLILVLLGVAVEFLGDHSKPGDSEGGGPVGALTLVGLMLFFVLFGLMGLGQWIYRRTVKMPGTRQIALSATLDPPISGYRRLAILESRDGVYLLLSRTNEGPHEFDQRCESVEDAREVARTHFGVAEEEWKKGP